MLAAGREGDRRPRRPSSASTSATTARPRASPSSARPGVDYPSIYAPDGRALLAFSGKINLASVPSTVVLDDEGRVAAVISGPVPGRTTLVDVIDEVADSGDGAPAAARAGGAPVGEWFSDQAASGSLLLAIPVALVAGLVSFFSPCVIPLLPGYLSYATGLSGADLENAQPAAAAGCSSGRCSSSPASRWSSCCSGRSFGAMGGWLVEWRRELTVVMGSLTILLGLVFMGVVPWFQRDYRVHTVPAVGLAAAPLLGFLFGLGWTPCIGPTLGAIYTLSVADATAARGALLSAVYAIGLGLPFVVAGLAYRRALGAFAFVRRHQLFVVRAGGLMLVLVGLALVTGWWDHAVTWLQVHLVQSSETRAVSGAGRARAPGRGRGAAPR